MKLLLLEILCVCRKPYNCVSFLDTKIMLKTHSFAVSSLSFSSLYLVSPASFNHSVTPPLSLSSSSSHSFIPFFFPFFPFFLFLYLVSPASSIHSVTPPLSLFSSSSHSFLLFFFSFFLNFCYSSPLLSFPHSFIHSVTLPPSLPLPHPSSSSCKTPKTVY